MDIKFQSYKLRNHFQNLGGTQKAYALFLVPKKKYLEKLENKECDGEKYMKKNVMKPKNWSWQNE